MKNERKEKMLNLLADKAVFGLDESEFVEFENLSKDFPELENDYSFEKSAAAYNLLRLEVDEKLPEHLSRKILADSENYFAASETEPEDYQKTFAFEPKRSIRNSLGWLVAALACLVLIGNIWLTRVSQPTEIGGVTPTPTASPNAPGLAEQREQLLASAGDLVKENWTDFPKDPHGVKGDVVWSNSQQKGFVRFQNLPVNDKTKESYQLWIGDKDQSNPVDGGVFNVDQNGDVIIPINAKLKISQPEKFIVTAEKPGGVVVSKLGKVMAIAKVSA